MSIAATRRSLIVAGATGAIGREVVVQAVSDARFGRVVALSRRTLTPNQFADTFPGIDAAKAAEKLSVVGVDWEALTVSLTPAAGCHRPASVTVPDESFPEGVRAAFANIDCAAMCMGTTKKDAGSAEAFVRVDFDYVVTFISLLRRFSPTSVTRYVQISSSGASATSYFLYMKTKGRADEAAVAAGFPHVVIMRPDLLGAKTRPASANGFSACSFLSCPSNASPRPPWSPSATPQERRAKVEPSPRGKTARSTS